MMNIKTLGKRYIGNKYINQEMLIKWINTPENEYNNELIIFDKVFRGIINKTNKITYNEENNGN